jgi:hypothetical protein
MIWPIGALTVAIPAHRTQHFAWRKKRCAGNGNLVIHKTTESRLRYHVCGPTDIGAVCSESSEEGRLRVSHKLDEEISSCLVSLRDEVGRVHRTPCSVVIHSGCALIRAIPTSAPPQMFRSLGLRRSVRRRAANPRTLVDMYPTPSPRPPSSQLGTQHRPPSR